MTATTKTGKLLQFFKNGGNITEMQARSRFNLKNLSATVNNLRNQGYAVYANQKVSSTGQTLTVYRLGHPTRAIIAAGYQLLGVGGYDRKLAA